MTSLVDSAVLLPQHRSLLANLPRLRDAAAQLAARQRAATKRKKIVSFILKSAVKAFRLKLKRMIKMWQKETVKVLYLVLIFAVSIQHFQFDMSKSA